MKKENKTPISTPQKHLGKLKVLLIFGLALMVLILIGIMFFFWFYDEPRLSQFIPSFDISNPRMTHCDQTSICQAQKVAEFQQNTANLCVAWTENNRKLFSTLQVVVYDQNGKVIANQLVAQQADSSLNNCQRISFSKISQPGSYRTVFFLDRQPKYTINWQIAP